MDMGYLDFDTLDKPNEAHLEENGYHGLGTKSKYLDLF